MSSLAQEESRSISENVTWGQRKRFADGKVNLPYKQFLGYRKGADGFPEVVPDEAIVVRRIYTRFMEGLTPGAIAKELTADGIPTPSEKTTLADQYSGKLILQNEKYKGAALLQKCFTVDFLTKKRKVNEGEVPQYYVEHSHEPIITPEEFDKVQTELARRKSDKPSVQRKEHFFLPASSAGTAAPTLARKSGTRPQNTAGSSGNATANSRVSSNAKRRIWTRKPLKRGL